METWFIIITSISIAALLKALINLIIFPKKQTLPPGPFTFPVISNLLWLLRSSTDREPILRKLHAKFGPIVTLPIGSSPAIFIADRSLAHKALIQNGAVFANRPPASPIARVLTNDQRTIVSAFYGPTWRLLRRNLTSEILHPSRLRSYKQARKRVLQILLHRLKLQSKIGDPCRVVDHFHHTMFCLLVFICFGEKLDQDQIKIIESIQRRRLSTLARFMILNFWPRLTKIVFFRKWEQFFQIVKDHERVLVPLIRARKKLKEERTNENHEEHVLSYVDTLLDLQIPEEKRKLSEQEIVSLCSELMTAGTDTTSTVLQWIMANLVKYPHIQEKLYLEINGVIKNRDDDEEEEEEVKEEDLNEMPYLKAVILEGLRRHPPGNFVLPHAVTEDFTLDGYVIPRNAIVDFMVAEMGRDPKVWEDPMEFKPERFLRSDNGDGVEDLDITGSREIKMMPFGAGRRICPGLGLAMVILEYFVANLVWGFEWRAVDGDEIDLSEKQEFTTVMKNPLMARISPRIR